MGGERRPHRSALKREIRRELMVLQANPAAVLTERGAWALGICRRYNWYPRIAAGLAAEANKLSGKVR